MKALCIVLLGLASVATAAAEPIPGADRNGDGQVVIACLGDSNTDSGWQSSKPGGFPRDRGWCEQLERLFGDPDVRVVNMGVGGATVNENPIGGVEKDHVFFGGPDQLDWVLKAEPVDAAVMAFGTSDVLPDYGRTPVEIADAYNRLLRRLWSEGRLGLIATTPPVYVHRSGQVRRSLEAIAETNAWIARTFPPRYVLDFHTGATEDEYLDDLHMNAAGQARRAAEVRRGLEALAAVTPPRAGVRSLRWSAGHWSDGSSPSGAPTASDGPTAASDQPTASPAGGD